MDQELLSEMYQAGCRLIHFGIESASARLLHKTGKEMDLRRVKAGVRRAQELGMETACFFMFGFPDETDQERRETFELAKRLNPTYASFHAVTAYPGTVLCSEVIGQDDVYSINSRYLERQELGPFLRKTYLRYYLRPSYLLERLRRGNFGVLWRQVRLFWKYVRA